MPHTKNILIVCRSVDELRLLSRIKIEPESNYIVASDDIRVHKTVEKYLWVNKICFIEKMESFYNVADDVIRFLEIINRWLESLGDDQHGIPRELLFWTRHAEGGMTTQRIQDLLLLIRSYIYLLDFYEITNVKILCHSGMHWEDSVLTQTARSRDVDVQIIGRFRISVLTGRAISFLKTIAREPYYLLNIFRTKFSGQLSLARRDSHENEIVVQPCGSKPKHLQHVIPLMKSINEKGYDSVALCWEMFDGTRHIRSKGLRAEELENWLPISAIWKTSFRTLIAWSRAILRRKEFMLIPTLQYQSVSIAELLWSSVDFFFIGELPQRYRLMIAAKKYFEVHSPLAIRFCTTILPQSVIPFRCLQKDSRTIIFHAPGFPYAMKTPYHHHIIPVDLVFALDTEHKDKLEKEEYPSNNVVVTGHLSRRELIDFKEKYSQNQSLSYLKIPSTYSIYVFYDPGYILRGYLAPGEQVRTTDFLLDFAKSNPSVALIIKPHPGHHPGILESQIESYSLQNVFLINNRMLPHHCLNAADLIIAKYSTIGIEAMYLDHPIISVILDGDANFKVFGNAAEYVYTIQELRNLLSMLIINDEDYKSRWVSKFRERAIKYLDLYDYRISKSPYKLTANAVDAFIKEKKI